MSMHCTLLVRLNLIFFWGVSFGTYLPALPGPVCAAAQATATTVHGTLPSGSRFEFRAPGSPDRKSAAAGDKGAYSLSLDPGRYEVIWVQASGTKLSEMVWIGGSDVTLNAEDGEGSKHASAQEFDLLADWRVTSPDGQGAAAQVTIQAELTNGRTENVTVWVLSAFGDEEKETAPPLATTPDGRVLFRVHDNRLRPDRVVALRVSAQAGARRIEQRLAPILEFSASGHLHAIYPDSLILKLNP